MLASRIDALLTRARLRIYPAILLVGGVVALLITSWSTPVPFPDFLARWTAGMILRADSAPLLYDPVTQSTIQAGLGTQRLSWFVSPPYVATLFSGFAALPYAVAAVAWVAASTAGLVAGIWLTLRRQAWAGLSSPWALVAVLAAQPVLEVVGSGQDSVIVLGAAIGANVLHRRRPFVAGVVLGLALVKPQLAYLIPIALVVLTRRDPAARRMLAGFGTTAVAFVTLGTWTAGADSWGRWLAALGSPLYRTDVAVGQAWKSVDLAGFTAAIAPTGWASAASTLGLILGLVIVATAVSVWWRTAWSYADVATALWPVTVVAAPHAMVYDLVVLIPSVLALIKLAHTRVGGERVRLAVVLAFVLSWLAPLLHTLTSVSPWPLRIVGAPWVVLPLLGLARHAVRPPPHTVE